MIPLRVKSFFSLLQATASPADLCRRAKDLGYKSLALTDHENLYGLWQFLSACKREGLKPIVGAELEQITFLVRDSIGYSNLCSLITRKKLSGTLDILKLPCASLNGLILLLSVPDSLEQLHENGACVVADVGNRPTASGSRLRKRAIPRGIPAVATPGCIMARQSEQPLYRLIQAIKTGSLLLGTRRESKAAFVPALEPPQFYNERFAVWPEVLPATEMVAEQCDFTGPDFGIIMPPWHRGNREESRDVLRAESYDGARRRYGDLSETVVERLEYELQIIEQMNFSSYFLVVRDIVHPLQPDGRRRQRRICGRGSGAASLVAYCLGITNVCPIRYNLYFERFLNPGRSDPPDIDIDFAWDERDSVLDEVLARFGNRAAMVCNHVTFKPRMAVRETARAYGLPGYEISRMTKRLPWFYRRDDEELHTQMADLPTLKDQDFSAPWPEIIRRAGALIGLPRYLSVHPGGVVITPAPVSTYVPVERAAKGVPLIQWEKDGAEEAGLVKIDLLGNRSLGVIRDAIANIRRNDLPFSEQHWTPEDDPKTRSAVSQGRTMGCFYIESPAMRLLQRKAGTGDFEQLVLQSSIIRPAANEFIREYVRRLQGGAWNPLHSRLETVLDETFGLMVYQEDVSRVAVSLAGFTHSAADGLRKVLSKKDREMQLCDYRQAFYAGCRYNGLEDEQIEQIWKMMMSFDGYSFCKPHSASYARVSFQAAYLKTHFPAEFMAAVISNQGGYYSTFAYVSEAKRHGITIDPPDVRVSDYHWSGKKQRIRVGLQAIAELSLKTADRIQQCRQTQQFLTSTDFLQRVVPAENEIRSLIYAGALDCLSGGGSRASLLWEAVNAERRRRDRDNMSLFVSKRPDPPVLPGQSTLGQLRREYRALGFLCRSHPVCQLKRQKTDTMKAHDLEQHVGRIVWFAGWLLTGKVISTRTGDVMEFLTFEDETGIIETTFFPGTYKRYAHLLSSGKPYLLKGIVDSDYGAATLTVERVEVMNAA